jgi:hypothetical protein
MKWDSPVSKQRNIFNMSRSKLNHPKIKFACKDYNKRGGALGNIECAISGVIKEPLPPKPVVVENSKKIPTEVVE